MQAARWREPRSGRPGHSCLQARPDEQDEHDQEELVHQIIDNDTYLFSARLEIDFINEKYRLKLPVKEEYETLSGMIVSYAETIPEKGTIFQIDNYELKVLEVDETKISKVQLKIIEED